MSKFAIIFPGVGYHTDKPLLYYGKKLAREFGFDVIEVNYSGFEKDIRGKQDKMIAAFELALQQTEEILKDCSFNIEDEILCISKSVGTVVASAWQKNHGIPAKNIYFTPVEATFQFARTQSGIVFHGTSDPWVATEIVDEKCRVLQLPLYKTADANHSMECGEAGKDLQTMQNIIAQCKEYIKYKGV